MSNPFSSQSIGTAGPAIGAIVITPSDSANLSTAIRAVTIAAASGTLTFISSRDGQTYSTGHLPLGTYALCASRILATGTTASGLTGWI